MIKILLKLDVSLSKVALVFISLVACYYIYRCFFSSVSFADDKNIKAVSDDEESLLSNISENFDEEKPMINIEKNEIRATENYEPETEGSRKAQTVNVDDALKSNVKLPDQTKNTHTEDIKPPDDCFENIEPKCSSQKRKIKSPNIEPDNLIENQMINVEKFKIEAAEIYKSETEVARKAQTVNIPQKKIQQKSTKEIPNTSIKAFRPVDKCFETVDQNFSGSESNQKELKNEPNI